MAKSRGRKFAEITSPASGVFDITSVPTITNAKLQNSAMTLAGSSVSLGGTGVADTDALSEGSSNVYFTDARVQTFLGGGTLAGNVVVPDNRSIYLGSDSDFRMVHNTTNTQLINATGALQITSNGGFAVTGAATFSSTITATGNITGTLATAAQPNITCVGTLTGLAVTGNATITKESPTLTLTDSSSSRTLLHFVDDNNSVVRASGPLLLQSGGAVTALTLDASQNATFAGTITGTLATAAQTNITSLGTLTGLTSSGSIQTTGASTYFISNSSSSGDYIRIYAGSGTGKWDIYGNGANLRFSDNDSAGLVAFDTAATFGGNVGITGDIDASGLLKVGTNNTEYANNYLRFKSGGAAYFDHNTTGQHMYFRTSVSSTLDTTIMQVGGDGYVYIRGLRLSGADGSVNQIWQSTSNAMLGFAANGGDINFGQTSSSTMRLKPNGNVGIGETSPLGKLHIRGTDTTASSVSAQGTSLILEDTENGMTLLNSSSGAGYIWFADSDAQNGAILYDHAADAMRFRTGGNWDVLRINSNGHVRINYGSNDYTSHGNIDQYLFTVQTDYNTTGDQNLSIVNHNGNWVDGTTGSDSAYGFMWGYQNLIRAGIHYDHRGTEKFDFYSSYAPIRFRVRNQQGNTSPIGSESTMPVVMEIKQNAIGLDNPSSLRTDTTFTAATGHATKRWGFGAGRTATSAPFYTINESNVGVYVAYGQQSWTAHSDERIKDNITSVGTILPSLMNMRCVRYNLKTDPGNTKIGFIAQDWETNFPEVVDEQSEMVVESDGSIGMAHSSESTTIVKGLSYTETIPLLLKAIQEQQALIEALQTEVAALKE